MSVEYSTSKHPVLVTSAGLLEMGDSIFGGRITVWGDASHAWTFGGPSKTFPQVLSSCQDQQ